MKRSGKWILIVLAIVAAAGYWWWMSPASEKTKSDVAEKVTPTIGVASLNITDIDDDRIKMQSKVSIHNPLPVALKASGINFVIYIDSIKVIESAYEKPVSIQSSDSSLISLPMEVLAKPMAEVLKYFDKQKIDSANYTMEAKLDLDVPIAGERSFDVSISKKLPALRLPKIKIRDVDLNALALKSKGIDLIADITNPNLFPLKFKDGAFSFRIEDALEMQGSLEKVISIPAKGTQQISMHAVVADGNMLKSGWKILTDKKGTQFHSKFTGKVESDNHMFSDSKMVMNVKGTLDEIIKAVKKVK
jgi:LEA14-like dessication related protein